VNQPNSILKYYPFDCQPSQFEPLGNAGGMSGAQFWRIAAPRGTLILRRWPQEHPNPDRLRFIYAVLEHAAQRDITFLPVPIRATTGESFIQNGGHLWELAPWMPGAADYERSPTIEKLRSAMRALAHVHIAISDIEVVASPRLAGQTPAVARRLKLLQELQSGGTTKLSTAITNPTWPELKQLAQQFLPILPEAVPHAIAQLTPLANIPLPLQLCLRDIWHDHILFTGNEVTGIIDFGAIDIDTPAVDIARLLGSLVGADATGWHTGITAYSMVRPLAHDEIRAVTALDTSGTLLAGCNWLRWIYVEEREFENRPQVIERFRRIVARITQM
jgi:Ser/Thr protein kinase RdoA (MazF antagonist)